MNLQIFQVAVLVPDMKKLLVCISILLFVKKMFLNLPARTMSANLTVFAFVDIAKNKCPNFTKHTEYSYVYR